MQRPHLIFLTGIPCPGPACSPHPLAPPPQAWIADAQAAAPANSKPEDDVDVIRPQGKWVEPELSHALPSPGPVGGVLVSVGGAFVVDDIGYVTL